MSAELEAAQRLAEEQEKLTNNMGRLRGATTTVSNTFGGLSSATGDFARQLSSAAVTGKASMDTMSAAVGIAAKTATTTIDLASDAIGGLAKMVPVIGDGLSQLTTGAAQLSKATIEKGVVAFDLLSPVIQAQIDSYHSLTSVGGLATGSLGGFRDMALSAGISVQQFEAVVKSQSNNLAIAFRTASKGAETIGASAEQFRSNNRDQYDQLVQMGYKYEEIVELMGTAAKLEWQSGSKKLHDTRHLGDVTYALAFQMDALARITGKNREQIEKETEERQREWRYKSALNAMDATQAREIDAAVQTFKDTGQEELAQAIKSFVAGKGAGAGAVDLWKIAGEGASDLFKVIRGDRSVSGLESISSVLAGAEQRGTGMQEPLRYIHEPFAEALGKAATFDFGDFSEKYNKARAEQVAHVEARRTDIATTSALKIYEENQNLMLNLQGIAFEAMEFAAPVIAKFGEGLNNAIDALKKFAEELGVTGGSAKNILKETREADGKVMRDISSAAKASIEESKKISTAELLKSDPGFRDHIAKKFGASFNPEGRNLEETKEAYLTNKMFQQYGGKEALEKYKKEQRDLGNLHLFSSGRWSEDALKRQFIEHKRQQEIAEKEGVADALKREQQRREAYLKERGEDPTKVVGSYSLGGVAKGPESGFFARLHGTEAIVPLPDGRTIPVSIDIKDQLSKSQLPSADRIAAMLVETAAKSQQALENSLRSAMASFTAMQAIRTESTEKPIVSPTATQLTRAEIDKQLLEEQVALSRQLVAKLDELVFYSGQNISIVKQQRYKDW